jgi:hypothetical protein
MTNVLHMPIKECLGVPLPQTAPRLKWLPIAKATAWEATRSTIVQLDLDGPIQKELATE